MFYRTYLVASKHTTLKQILTDFMRLSVKDTVVLSIPRKKEEYPGCQRLFLRGFWSLSNLYGDVREKLRHWWLRPLADTEDSRRIW